MKLNKIYNECCLKTMQRMDDDFIDLTVTSPPYDDLRDYEGYHFPFEKVAKCLYKVTKKGGVVVWVVGDQTVNGSETGTSFKQALYFKEIGFNLHDTMIYHRNTMPQNNKRYEQHFEYMFILVKGKLKTFNGIREKRKWIDNRKIKQVHMDKTGKRVTGYASDSETVLRNNVWKINSGGGHSTLDKFAFEHPAIFPEELASNHIRSWSNVGDIVYDPCSGSGTTAKVAMILQRQYVGSEISKKYCLLAERRIQNEKQQGRFDLIV